MPVLLLFFNYPAVFKPHDPVAIGGVRFGVRYLNDGDAFIIEALKHVHDFFALTGVEVSSWLVGEDDPGISYDSSRDAYKLLLTAR